MKLTIMHRGLVLFLMFSTIMLACSTIERVEPDSGLDYYPLHVGQYALYQVEETNILFSTQTKTFYELKVIVNDSIVSDQGVTYFLIRQKRAKASDSWETLDTWSAQVTKNKIIQNEGNILFVKLTFPLSLNLAWDGNQFNNLADDGNLFTGSKSDQYFISDFNAPASLPSGFETDHALTVIHNDFSDNIVGVDQRKEIYAKGVGLIYKAITQLNYCTGSNCLGQQKIDKGVILIQSLKAYGQI